MKLKLIDNQYAPENPEDKVMFKHITGKTRLDKEDLEFYKPVFKAHKIWLS